MKVLIVEDEPLAAQILEEYVAKTPGLQLVGKCLDAHHALDAMQQQSVEVLLLDIHLPGLKGLDFLRTLPQMPQTILTTAYHEYALESYELGVVDYLLKPIDFQRFLKAISRLKQPEKGQVVRDFHFFNVNKKMVRVWLDEILVVESLREYVQLHLLDGQRLVSKYSLSQIEILLENRRFLRVHRSFLVARDHVAAFTATEVFLGKMQVPIGRMYGDSVEELKN